MLFLIIFMIFLFQGCLDYYDPVQREAARYLTWFLLVGIIIIFAILFYKLAAAGGGPIVWMILGIVSFLLIPHSLRIKIFNLAFALFVANSGIIVVLGETEIHISESLKQILYFLMYIGLLLLLPWGIAFTFKYGFGPIGKILVPPTHINVRFLDYFIWAMIKVVLIVIASRLLDRHLLNKGKSIFTRVGLRTLLIWILSFFPFPKVFNSLSGEILLSTGFTQVFDGIIDLLKIGEFLTAPIIAFVSVGLVLFTIPGIFAFYKNTLGPPWEVLLPFIFVTFASRVYFMLIKYKFIY